MKTIGARGVSGGDATPPNSVHENLSMHRSGPPLTAIDRFLWGQHSHHFPHKHQRPLQNDDQYGANSTYSFVWPNNTTTHQEEASFVDDQCDLLANEDHQVLNWAHQIPTLCSLQKDDNNVQVLGKGTTGAKGVGRRPNKKGSSSSSSSHVSLIKGQWTDEEDRLISNEIKQNYFLLLCIKNAFFIVIYLH